MTKKLFTLPLVLLLFLAVSGQQFVLFTETFENPTNQFVFDSAGPSANTGPNKWIVNSVYDGQGINPNTPSEDSVVSGNIFNAPHSKYLHIYEADDVGTPANASWTPDAASDRFVYAGSSFCTLGLTDVTLAFFWACEGDSTNGYGQVYYSANGGPWMPTGQAKYYGQSKWKYEAITDPAFNNCSSLQFGFRWVNRNAGNKNVSFSIDDVIAGANYNAITNPATLHVQVLDTPLCQGDQVLFYLSIAPALCNGNYDIQMSNANGSFQTYTDLGYLTLGPEDSIGYYLTVGTPGNLSGSCFRVRVVRTSPLPAVIGDTSFCFTIKPCPNLIYNLKQPVLTDVDTACINSEIDVFFNSQGVFHNGNQYIAELSDSTGSFADSTRLGVLAKRDSFPDPMQPGDVSGLIPEDLPAGCGYFLRIRSTNPPAVSALQGPFCLVHCDDLTNDHTDLHFCVASGPFPQCDTIHIQPHYWDNNADYATCNDWKVELKNMKTFATVSSNFVVYHDSAGGYFTLCMPSTVDSLTVAPGTYYMRIVSTCSNVSYDQNGTIIRITIGAPGAEPPTLVLDPPYDSVFCKTELIVLDIDPYNMNSQYQWNSDLLYGGNPFIWPGSSLAVQLNPTALVGDYKFYVQEINNGCYGPQSAPKIVYIIDKVGGAITGPPQVCIGDTVQFSVTFFKETLYNWSASLGAQVLDASNSQASFIFDSIGTFTISNTSVNKCGSDAGSLSVKVVSPYKIDAGLDTATCAGQPVTLKATTYFANKVLQSIDTGTVKHKGGMFDLIAHNDVYIDSFAVRLQYNSGASNIANSEIFMKNGTFWGSEHTPNAWTAHTAFFNYPVKPSLQWTTIPVQINRHIVSGDTTGFYVSLDFDNPQYELSASGNAIFPTVYRSDGNIDFVYGTANDSLFGASYFGKILNIRIYYHTKGGQMYAWSTGDTGTVITVRPQVSTQYTAYVFDSSGCQNKDQLFIRVDSVPAVSAGPDTVLCPGTNLMLHASTNGPSYVWSPGTGLSDTSSLTPVFNYTESMRYYFIARADNGCADSAAVNITITPFAVNAGPDTLVCSSQTYMMQGYTSLTPTSLQWSPADGLSAADIPTPMFTGSDASTVYTLTAIDSAGCVVSDSVTIMVGECNSFLQVPSGFTPNGDGSNEYFTVFGKNISQYQIRIFNRWGEEVYSSNDVGELNTTGWDGSFKGKKQDTGTFVYYISATDLNNKHLEKKGNITLIR